MPVPLTYSIVSPPVHGAISNFNASTGTFTYTPAAGFTGIDTFTYDVEATGPNAAEPAATSNPSTVTITVAAQSQTQPQSPPPAPPLVTVTEVKLTLNKKHQVTQVLVTFSGTVDSTEAEATTTYRLATPGKHGSLTAKNAGIIHLKKTITQVGGSSFVLKPKKPFALTKKVQLEILGSPPSGLQDSFGRYIDGADAGQAGTNAIAILTRRGVSL